MIALSKVLEGAALAMLLALTCAMIVPIACTGTPDERAAKFAKAEADLCKIRAAEALAEAVTPELMPLEGSTRARIEIAEDEFCAALAAKEAGP